MARPETLQDLIDERGAALAELAAASGISLRALLKLRQGIVDVARAKTVSGLAKALKMPTARVRAACEASRAAAGK